MAAEGKKPVENKETEVKTEELSTVSVVEPKEVKEVKAEVPKAVKKETKLDKIKGKFILKRIRKTYVKKMFDKQEDAAVLFSKNVDTLQVPLVGENFFLTGIVDEYGQIDKELQAEFEAGLNLEPGSLSPYNSKYWSTFKFTVNYDGGTKLDCDNNIKDKLIYCIIKAESQTLLPKFALSQVQAEGNPIVEYVLENAEKEASEKNKLAKVKMEAYKLLSELTIQGKMDFLTVFEGGRYRLTNQNKPDFIESTTFDIMEKNPEKFVNTLNDPHYKEYLFINTCVREGVLNKTGVKLFTKEGDLIGNTQLEAVLNIKSPEYNHIKLDLLAKLEAKK